LEITIVSILQTLMKYGLGLVLVFWGWCISHAITFATLLDATKEIG